MCCAGHFTSSDRQALITLCYQTIPSFTIRPAACGPPDCEVWVLPTLIQHNWWGCKYCCSAALHTAYQPFWNQQIISHSQALTREAASFSHLLISLFQTKLHTNTKPYSFCSPTRLSTKDTEIVLTNRCSTKQRHYAGLLMTCISVLYVLMATWEPSLQNIIFLMRPFNSLFHF